MNDYPICMNCGNLTIHKDGTATCPYALNCRKRGKNTRFIVGETNTNMQREGVIFK